ncbi:SHOCT domain-containing protein [Vibrio sp. 10N.261.51.A3]|uniref:SHOCT domain-containing protein n=1 Tax=Vibrio sp. 10N.261.51.A3 TaxID=3229673 RepID=UPI00354F497F
MSKLVKYMLGGLPYLIYDHMKSNEESNEVSASSITTDEVERINDAINNAKNSGAKEVSINISRNLHDELSLGGNIPNSSGLDVQMNLKSDTSGMGQCQLHIIFLEPDEHLDKLAKLKDLHQCGALTEEEFSNAKARVIERL